MKTQTFEDYLKDRHIEMFPEILDDDLPDHFDNWLANVEVDDLLTWADLYGTIMFLEGKSQTLK